MKFSLGLWQPWASCPFGSVAYLAPAGLALCSSAILLCPRSLLMFTMENCFYLLISQAMRYLRDPAVHPRDKQRMKQELSSELVLRGAGVGPEGKSQS